VEIINGRSLQKITRAIRFNIMSLINVNIIERGYCLTRRKPHPFPPPTFSYVRWKEIDIGYGTASQEKYFWKL